MKKYHNSPCVANEWKSFTIIRNLFVIVDFFVLKKKKEKENAKSSIWFLTFMWMSVCFMFHKITSGLEDVMVSMQANINCQTLSSY